MIYMTYNDYEILKVFWKSIKVKAMLPSPYERTVLTEPTADPFYELYALYLYEECSAKTVLEKARKKMLLADIQSKICLYTMRMPYKSEWSVLGNEKAIYIEDNSFVYQKTDADTDTLYEVYPVVEVAREYLTDPLSDGFITFLGRKWHVLEEGDQTILISAQSAYTLPASKAAVLNNGKFEDIENTLIYLISSEISNLKKTSLLPKL